MSDFTKEELQDIEIAMGRMIGDDCGSGISEKLIEKIKHMIHDFCDHIFIYITETPECIGCGAIPDEFKKDDLT